MHVKLQTHTTSVNYSYLIAQNFHVMKFHKINGIISIHTFNSINLKNVPNYKRNFAFKIYRNFTPMKIVHNMLILNTITNTDH